MPMITFYDYFSPEIGGAYISLVSSEYVFLVLGFLVFFSIGFTGSMTYSTDVVTTKLSTFYFKISFFILGFLITFLVSSMFIDEI